MQGKSQYYFPNHLLFAALANILGRTNPHTIFPPILCASGVFGFRESGATPTGGQRKKINIPLVTLAL